jgi:ApaG protein
MPHKILVSVKTNYLADQTLPRQRYVYSYTITIANEGDEAAQLISRHWLIRDAKDNLQEVQGIGVIGEQPHIVPGASYTYTSGVVLETETGMMEGSYQMRADSGETFDAEIPTFALVPPHAMH